MIDLKKEIEKYKPVLEIDGIEDDINNNDVEDIMDLIEMLENRE